MRDVRSWLAVVALLAVLCDGRAARLNADGATLTVRITSPMPPGACKLGG